MGRKGRTSEFDMKVKRVIKLSYSFSVDANGVNAIHFPGNVFSFTPLA